MSHNTPTPHQDPLHDAARAFADLPLEILYALVVDISPGRPVDEYGALITEDQVDG